MGEKQLPDWVAFGRELRRLRTSSGLSLHEVGGRLSITPGMLSKLERATRAPKRDTVGELDQAFSTNGALLRRWSDVTRKATDPDWYRRVEDAEAAAVELRVHHPSLIPGSLQTEDYARTVVTYGRPLDTTEEIDAILGLKTKRVERLLRPGDPALSAVIPEEVIRSCLGDAETVAGQLDHLVNLAESNLLRLYVIPHGVPTHIGQAAGAFSVISFTDRLPLAFTESASGGELVDQPREVQRFVSLFGILQGWALSPADSIELIRRAQPA
ncbi:transcriptional regulator with XRE-family HTH domain [Spinactinospora alkalitolerans]|uniref:Transcriptional regulator with XRE-family HTH domain n=1 Tax=Spinactinospora alkalitolerans TaxID=687207 RepID=A0A852U397_9ACTN|nr:helix-turn-helix transcriptional regulator [Spinactinospora alkalitolerans]NYE49932.1 transcriptional regulator with XRE-family HTH domain [Spinactinospora alkalitolerans]